MTKGFQNIHLQGFPILQGKNTPEHNLDWIWSEKMKNDPFSWK